MKEELICKIIERKQKVILTTKNRGIYTGHILVYGDNAILFRDKFGDEMMFSIDVIESITPVREKEKK